MGYDVEIVNIDWERKQELVENGDIDCIMGCFSMKGRLDDYKWAGPYMISNQVVAVNKNSDIYTLVIWKERRLPYNLQQNRKESFCKEQTAGFQSLVI